MWTWKLVSGISRDQEIFIQSTLLRSMSASTRNEQDAEPIGLGEASFSNKILRLFES